MPRSHPLDERPQLDPQSLNRFEEFMACYPRPEGRKRALDAWRELNPSAELAAVILADVRKRIAGGWADEPAYVPFPCRYLAERRWQERYAPTRAVRGQSDRALDSIACLRTCPACGAVQEGMQRDGRKVFAPCPCEQDSKVGA